MHEPKSLTSAEIWLSPPAIPFLSNWLTHPVTVKEIQNLTNWKNAFFHRPDPYLTDMGFPNPLCPLGDGAQRSDAPVRGGRSVSARGPPTVRNNHTTAGTYVIGRNNDCLKQNNTDHFCNGPLKPKTVYVWVQHTNTQQNKNSCMNGLYVNTSWHWTVHIHQV